ncbi:hypothetical protein JW859_11125 [bacterium]|nr:hypothetical protein [bacterium]
MVTAMNTITQQPELTAKELDLLKLEPDEHVITWYQSKYGVLILLYFAMGVILASCLIIGVAVLITGDKEPVTALTGLLGTLGGMVGSFAQLNNSRVYVTNKMLIFREGNKLSGVQLADVTAIRRGQGLHTWSLAIQTRHSTKSAGKLSVRHPDKVARELAGIIEAQTQHDSEGTN